MGWAYYDNHRGRPCGYGVAATCDYPGCEAVIDRGHDFLCGTIDAIRGGGPGCGNYFCPAHRGHVRKTIDGRYAALCPDCADDPIDADYFGEDD